jgi:(1->4)-alpha-D-glucan 1-alpha-D-glucosylmutase
MTALSTHDTKRSGDVRARLAVLSEPGLAVPWPALAGRWLPRLAERWPHAVAPHAPTLLLALQTMVGAWPIDAGRLGDYLRKAGREAKERTSWTSPDEAFEGALEAVAGVVEEPGFAAAFDAETAEIRRLGASNTLVQAAVGLLAPGVPDVYQGNESVDLSLVDPDNRRPVDFDRLRFALDHDDRRPPPSPAGRLDGDATDHKLRLTAACLRLRRRRPESFGPGSAGAHRRLDVAGADGDRVVAFARGSGAALVAVRFPTRGPVDPGTTVLLPGHPWQPVFGGCATGGGLVPVAALCPDLPVAVLEAAR